MAKTGLFSYQFCPFSQRSRIALAVKGVDYILHEVDLARPYPPRLLELNPNAQVPTLVHDGNVVFESDVVGEYIDEVFPGRPLLPADPYRRALSRILILHGANTFIPLLYALLLNQDPGRDAELTGKALASWRWVNDFLLRHGDGDRYLFQEPGLADYAFGPFFQRWQLVEYYRGFALPASGDYARIAGWRAALLELAVVRDTAPSPETLIKVYADYARGYDNAKVPPDRERSSFDLSVPPQAREMPPRGLRSSQT
ncbi:MAG: glutathione S-transferase family protein [Pseudomonadota bacterium]|nr:glutathione S-transferase family protein [Pseudomonadota bacterium]